MIDLINKINNVHKLIFQNKCWIELLYAYCLIKSENIDEISYLTPLIKTILKENNELEKNFEEITTEYYKNSFLLDEKQ